MDCPRCCADVDIHIDSYRETIECPMCGAALVVVWNDEEEYLVEWDDAEDSN